MSSSSPSDGSGAPADTQSDRAALWNSAQSLTQDGHVLDRLAADLEAGGFAGSPVGAKVVYLAATTRLFQRPVSVVLRGPSSAGKSFTMGEALKFIPPEERVELTDMSPKALVYLDADLKHKVLTLAEEGGMQGEQVAYLVRSLLSEGRLNYTFVDWEDGRTTRTITKDGPTVLITTTAGRIDSELGTRLTSVAVEDSSELTAAIIMAEARTLAGEGEPDPPTMTVYHDLQRYIATGDRDVVVPFARQIAALTDTRAVRIRRDFSAAMGLVRAHALLGQRNFVDGDPGKVEATKEDYGVVWRLISDSISEAADAQVPASVRETVEALHDVRARISSGDHSLGLVASAKAVAGQLGLSRSAASRRLSRAHLLGLVNEMPIAGSTQKAFTPDEPLPADSSVLPSPDAL